MEKEQNIPDKYRIHNREKDNKLIFNYDTQGWPQYKQNVRDILIGFGCSYNEKSNKWEISDGDPRLDSTISVLFDDGMGYGVNEHFICEASSHIADDRINKTYANIFVDKELDKIELWRDAKFYDGAWVKKIKPTCQSNLYSVFDIEKDNDGTVLYKCHRYVPETETQNLMQGEIVWFKEDEIDYD